MLLLFESVSVTFLGEGDGTPLQCSCLENPIDGGTWWACSPWGREESDTTELPHFHFSLSCIGEGNGNPLQCACLEDPRDGGAWWAAVSGVAQSRKRLKRLSSSSSSSITFSLLPCLCPCLPLNLRWVLYLSMRDQSDQYHPQHRQR